MGDPCAGACSTFARSCVVVTAFNDASPNALESSIKDIEQQMAMGGESHAAFCTPDSSGDYKEVPASSALSVCMNREQIIAREWGANMSALRGRDLYWLH